MLAFLPFSSTGVSTYFKMCSRWAEFRWAPIVRLRRMKFIKAGSRNKKETRCRGAPMDWPSQLQETRSDWSLTPSILAMSAATCTGGVVHPPAWCSAVSLSLSDKYIFAHLSASASDSQQLCYERKINKVLKRHTHSFQVTAFLSAQKVGSLQDTWQFAEKSMVWHGIPHLTEPIVGISHGKIQYRVSLTTKSNNRWKWSHFLPFWVKQLSGVWVPTVILQKKPR